MMTPIRKMLTRSLKQPLHIARLILWLVVDRICVLLVRKRESNIALIVRLDAIGDFVVWLQCGADNVCRHLRKDHSKLVLLANPAWSDFARSLNLWDEVIPLNGDAFVRSLPYRIRQIAMIRKMGVRTLIQPRAARLFLLDDEIAAVCGASLRVGSDAVLANTTPALRRLGNTFYDRIVTVPLCLSEHETIRATAFAQDLAGETVRSVLPTHIQSSTFIMGDLKGRPYVVLAPGAGWSGRQWPASNFAKLAEFIDDRFGLPCVLIGVPSEMRIAREVESAATVSVRNLVGQTSLADTISIISHATLLVSNESGPLHIGYWAKTKVVGIVGGGHFGWFAPYPRSESASSRAEFVCRIMPCFGCNWSCIYPFADGNAVPCVGDISLEQVTSAVTRLMES
jgi:ADP-heptose:LPS heptosyltransferase